MDVLTILTNGLWAGLSAAGLAVMLTAPVRYLLAAFVCGCIGRGLRDTLTACDISVNWATVVATTVVVLIAVAVAPRRRASPVVLICALLPLGAALAMFNLIFALMRISTATGHGVSEAAIALSASAGKVFVTSLAIALGLAAGLAIERLFKRNGLEAV